MVWPPVRKIFLEGLYNLYFVVLKVVYHSYTFLSSRKGEKIE